MKKIAVFLFLGIFLAAGIHAQTTKPNYIKRPALGIHVNLFDFKDAAYIRNNSLSGWLKDPGARAKIKDMDLGMAVSYWQGVTNHIDFAANLAGTFLKYPFKDRPQATEEKFLMELDATANFKLLTDNYWVSPYLTAGAGISKYSGYWGTYVPLGAGLQLNILDETFLQLQGQYRLGISDNTNYHFYWGLGFLGNIGKPREKPAPKVVEIPVIQDRDSDGVPDADDECPDLAGPRALKGCPDRDGDGIPDKDDKCPDQKGLARYQGCPPPDRDGDGILDADDACPDTPGVARYRGCPVPDTDGDGVNDEVDKCPLLAGPASNGGCPIISVIIVEKVNIAAKAIFFNSSSAKIATKSYGPLNDIVTILKENPDLNLSIEGHTDNTGSEALNQKLSQSRADAVRKYLVDKGIDSDRLTSTGFGPSVPIADNKTVAGRAANRRVVMKLSQ